MKKRFTKAVALTAIFLLFTAAPSSVVGQQKDKKPKLTAQGKEDRRYALAILDEIRDIMKEHYYDQNYKGMNLKARLEAAKERVKTLEFNWQMYRVIAQVLVELDDSHTNFHLPRRSDHFRYGISWQMIGDACFITSVKRNSDAFAQGVEVGDQVISIRNLTPTRADLWKMNYVIYQLDPSKQMSLKIVKPDSSERSVTIKAQTLTDKEFRAEIKARRERRKAKKLKNEYQPFRCKEVNKEIVGCKLDTFMVEKGDIDKMMKQASKYPKLILDLRGNGGGYVIIEEYLLSHFFDREVKIADLVTKKKTELRKTSVLSETRRYKGEIAVIVDSNSASAAEMTARVLQLEKRAKVYGDYSSGSVMTSIVVPFVRMLDPGTIVASNLFAMSVTIGDVIMSDGSRLEKVGVIPDIAVHPTAIALKEKMDPVFALAVAQLGTVLTPEAAGKFNFMAADEDDDGPEDGDTE